MSKIQSIYRGFERNVIGPVLYARSRSDYKRNPLASKIVVATHHKTGTQWMERIFHAISIQSGTKYVSYPLVERRRYDKYDIIMEPHSTVDFELLGGKYKGLHLIRDPRDCIVSGCFYHQVSRERWLHMKQKKFGGQTYQEKINGFSKLEDKLSFEMENAGQYTIDQMVQWNYRNAHFYEAKYEELIADESLGRFYKIFVFLGFKGSQIPMCLGIAYRNSLFSGRIQRSKHVRSGEAGQWRSFFTSRNRERFKSIFGSALIDLGYERDNDW